MPIGVNNMVLLDTKKYNGLDVKKYYTVVPLDTSMKNIRFEGIEINGLCTLY